MFTILPKTLKLIGLTLAFTALTACNNDTNKSNAEITNDFYNDIVSGDAKIAALNLFVTQMPKGGDIHHHYSGAIYAEDYLDWVTQNNSLIDSCSFHVVQQNSTPSADCPAWTVAELKNNTAAYRQLLMLWSDMDYGNHYHQQPSPDLNFFNTFKYFSEIANTQIAEGLSQLKQRALNENVSYIETMLDTVGFEATSLYSSDEITALNTALRDASNPEAISNILNKITLQLEASTAFSQQLKSFVKNTETAHKGIDDSQFLMRFQTFAVRTMEPLQVFIDLYSGFRASYASDLFVGVNIVAPENNHVSLADYSLHMQMFNYLRHNVKATSESAQQSVNLALHAGELTLGMVTPENLQFHINQAVDIAGAQRIGHGVDIVYEQKPVALLKTMKEKNLAVEINLTSNEFILGVEGNNHPYLLYAAYGVPMIISTDDAGVSRNNLSNQYMLLAQRYNPPYQTLKDYAYNSISYSFLSDADKATARENLDQRFVEFEANMAQLHYASQH